MTHTRPIWADIARSRLLHNYRHLQQLAGSTADLLTVVKADAYGHALSLCAPALAAAGAGWFGVTSVEEAVKLRALCPAAHILAMSGPMPGEADGIFDHGLTPVVWDPGHLDLVVEAGRRRGVAAGTVPVHLEIDTGMSRQGVQPEQLGDLLRFFGPGSPLRLEAVMTHFHSPEDPQATQQQIHQLSAAIETLANNGLHPQFISAGSSADLLEQSTAAVTNLATQAGARRMVRAGLALYGYSPAGAAGNSLQPVLAWKARIVSLRDIPAGATAGYGATFHAQRPTRLALLPVGYADGLSRALSNRGEVLIRGQRAPIAGRISMDQTMIDVTDIPGVAAGDEVAIIGEQGSQRITAADLAQLTGTIPYEVLCGITARVPRVMVD